VQSPSDESCPQESLPDGNGLYQIPMIAEIVMTTATSTAQELLGGRGRGRRRDSMSLWRKVDTE
jgi:hypothetical protein